MRHKTSWQTVHSWYDKHQSEDGGYYHREVIFPKLLASIKLDENSRVLDLGCGEGILGRKLAKINHYVGIDASSGLIKKAKIKDSNKSHHYQVGDVTYDLKVSDSFTHAFFVLSIQNISNPKKALESAWKNLEEGGSLSLVINHPCFRIPQNSSWDIDLKANTQSRKLKRYLSPFRSAIKAHPSKKEFSETTLSFHYSLSNFFSYLKDVGFYVEDFIEVCSNRKSYGKKARAENFARAEFPLFLIMNCRKHSKLNK
ncbi:MAG: Ubiquinone biosynthesis O-methyltransferase, mitochondrial [Chlamydiae bacterium]|nr:Ubiquinone biosynthesis O-methyltransferase, mitochondrial [Chlamydiota bacterium]